MGGPMTEVLMRQVMVVNIAILSLAAASVASTEAKPGCNSSCGNLEIPYPFGTKEGCYLDKTFLITCNTTHYDPPKPFLRHSNIEVTNISISEGELHVTHYVARDCYTENGRDDSLTLAWLKLSNFTISSTKNKFTVIGCDTTGFISGTIEGESYRSGCMALCGKTNKTVSNGTCSGNGCCQLGIPKSLKSLEVAVGSFNNHSDVLQFNPCGYAFVVQQNFHFFSQYLSNFPHEKVQLVLDWSITNDTCLAADKITNCGMCGPNTDISTNFSVDGSEFRCHCLKGFDGNPYLGCQNINECQKEELNDCIDIHHCNDTVGGYTCFCPSGLKGDGKRTNGTGCIQPDHVSTKNIVSPVHIIIGVGVGFIVLLIGNTWIYLVYKRWKFIQRKERFFKKNGGFILQQLSHRQSPTDSVRIFTQEELEKATNKFDEIAVIGKGGYGTVYKGVFDDGLIVAIKKSKLVDQSQTDQFINEVIVLSQINHRNVVKLLGCCLETEVPLLVYEFITNGTLFDHIHNKTKYASLSWETRLKIASETAGVLWYLHSSASIPIIHRDIKPTNILLDHNYTAKVSDFGASKLVPLDKTQLSTMVQGTLGYLDPEYLLTSELTEKSDVYSFGIVLLELITGKKAVCFDGPEVERNLAMYALCAMKEDRVEEIVDEGMATVGNFKQIIEMAKLAKECLKLKGEERPTMKDVAMELEGLRQMQIEHSLTNNNLSNAEEMTHLLHGVSNSSSFVVTGSMNTLDYSIKPQILTRIPDGR